MKKNDVAKVGELLKELETAPPVIVRETNGTPSKDELAIIIGLIYLLMSAVLHSRRG